MNRFVYKAVLSSKSSLSHHGIKNQKWGVRRYQNPDGSLTPEGRKRYGVGEKDASTKFKTSDVYAMEGAKRGGLLGAAVGKTIGVYKEKKEAKEQKKTEEFFKKVEELEQNSMYDFNVNSRKKPLAQNVEDTAEQLQKICDAHAVRLREVIRVVPGANPYDLGDSIYDGSFAKDLATRINERFDADHILDQHMDEWVHDYRNGLISKKEFKQHYESELNDYSAWVVDTHGLDELKKVAKTFINSEGFEPGEFEWTAPNSSWKSYLKRVDSLENIDSNALNRQNSKGSSGRYRKGSASSDLDKMEREDAGQSYNWKDPKATVKRLAKSGYSVGEIAADLPFDLADRGKEEEYVRKILGR